MKFDRHERKKSGRDRRAVSCQVAISFRCDWRPRCSQIAASPFIARRSRPLFPRSFQSDFTAKETARSLFENKNLSSQIIQLSTIFYNNFLSLARKKLGSHKRVFTVYASAASLFMLHMLVIIYEAKARSFAISVFSHFYRDWGAV